MLAPEIAALVKPFAMWGAIAGVVVLLVYLGFRRIRKGAVAEVAAEQAERREELHDEAGKELAKPPPTGLAEILARRKARRNRRARG